MNEKKSFNPWPVGITIFCISAFAFAALIVVVMVQKKVDLVRPDYYAQDLRHEKRMDQERRALENPAVITFDEAVSEISVIFPGEDITGTITLYRPSDSALDRIIPIGGLIDKRQAVDVSELLAGLWRVRVEWELDELSYYQEKAVILP